MSDKPSLLIRTKPSILMASPRIETTNKIVIKNTPKYSVGFWVGTVSATIFVTFALIAGLIWLLCLFN